MSNPELRRNLWLELTPHRLVGMPLILAVIFLLLYILDDYRFADGVANGAVGLYTLLAVLWGTRQAAETIISEIRDHTWDSQRMSVVGPWSMTLGKLFGSTIYPWYGGLLCLAVYAAAAPTHEVPLTESLLILLGIALFSQSVALLASLQAIRKDRRYSRSQAAAFLILGLGLGLPLLSLAFEGNQSILWYGIPVDLTDLALLSLYAFLGWAVIGVARLLRSELQMKSTPLVWCAFVLFAMVYVAGFFNAGSEDLPLPLLHLYAALVVGVTLTYGMAFSERKDPVAFHRLLQACARRNWRDFWLHLPLWGATLPLVAIAVGGLLLRDLAGSAPAGAGFSGVTAVAVFAFLLRDLALLLYLNLGRVPRRADMVAVLYLGLLYGVIPIIFATLDLDRLTLLFWPRWDMAPLPTVLAPVGELGLVAWLLIRRWQTQHRRPG
ncbi:MAG: hypothetical protein A2091_01690 [Desulfuromonadales bacterium GWD2_61_12]|nr:MAG: hypothetical protein A2005_07455 [Desulfuromonadales bacterium GWC2_61_20]OGR33093.1 MAG: hypothetical protein A2091_01690 [Desulfuromonadales bacterium GWD2_61_12]HAD04689.1 hypothetical protein [Desulfuromonas sp.]